MRFRSQLGMTGAHRERGFANRYGDRERESEDYPGGAISNFLDKRVSPAAPGAFRWQTAVSMPTSDCLSGAVHPNVAVPIFVLMLLQNRA